MQNSYYTIINSILKDKILSLEEKFMLITLKSLDIYGVDVVSASYETLMECLDTTRRAKVSNILKSLKEKEYIESKRQGRKENQYRFIKDYMIIGYRNETTNNKYSSENETLKQYNLYENETVNSYNSSNNETLEKFRDSKSETIDNSYNSIIETIDNANNSNNETITYETGSRFGTLNTVYNFKKGTTKPNYYNNINNIDIYDEIIKLWNSKNINQHIEKNDQVAESIYKAINVYGIEKVKRGIENYSKVYHSDYFYDFQWQLASFLTKPKGISRFLDDGDQWIKYKNNHQTVEENFEEYGINYEDYINL